MDNVQQPSYEEMMAIIESLKAENQKLREENTEVKAENKKLEEKCENLQATINELQVTNKNLQADNKEIIQQNKEIIQQNKEIIQQNNELKKISDKLIDRVSNLEERNKKNEKTFDMINDIIFNIQQNKPLENSIQLMGKIGKTFLDVEECDVYVTDEMNSRLYNSNKQGEKEYISPADNSVIQKAIQEKKPIIFDIDGNTNIGDGKSCDNLKTKNALVIPLENRYGDIIGVTVLKGKENGFTQNDINEFHSIESGSIGNFYRVAIESKTNSLQATTDKLTSLKNRQGMENFLKENVKNCINEGKSVSVAVFDIDKFKNFNDTYGHEVGDECLKQVANVIKNNLRSTSNTGAFRFGGEEFIVVLPTSEEKAKEIIDRIREKVENSPLDLNGKDIKITVSAGVAQLKPEFYGLTNEETISLFDETFVIADTALYHSKENGRNQVTASYEIDSQKINEKVSEYRSQSSNEPKNFEKSVKEEEIKHSRNEERKSDETIKKPSIKLKFYKEKKDFSFQMSNDSDYLMPDEDKKGINVHIESVGITHLKNMLGDAVKSGDIPKKIADEVLNGNLAYYDIYVDFRKDGNDTVTLVVTSEDKQQYYADFKIDQCLDNLVGKVAEEVISREDKTVDEIIENLEKNNMEK